MNFCENLVMRCYKKEFKEHSLGINLRCLWRLFCVVPLADLGRGKACTQSETFALRYLCEMKKCVNN